MGRSAGALLLSDEEEGSFGVGGAAGVRDCMFVLDCAAGLSGAAIAARHRTSQQTVSKWRGRFVRERLARLRPLSGPPGEGAGALRGREEPGPAARSPATVVADELRNARDTPP